MAKIKALFIHAHYDDFEFTAAGTFELWRQQLDDEFQARVIICTDGKAGHQFRSREETGTMRIAEMEASAEIGGFEFESLRYANGEIPREACLQVDVDLLSALWKEIRDFEPDYLFCPPVITDAFAGVHIDHVAVADAIRKVAYMINVPHAFTPEYPSDDPNPPLCKVPVIINCYDPYMHSSNALDVSVDISDAFDLVCEMSYCHKSQIVEWLPWVSSPTPTESPKDLDDWRRILRKNFSNRDKGNGLDNNIISEIFTITAWGSVPTVAQLKVDFPNIKLDEAALSQQLQKWGGAE
ncbi:MAG: PIG-L family deacetylase [Lentisphaeria bacterium]|nr:PIG-L family deacetylase [Lentisphaeria bacterium]NQZ69745.1 PIG-L family deacetylase [Lentisphaeria bacterium]